MSEYDLRSYYVMKAMAMLVNVRGAVMGKSY